MLSTYQLNLGDNYRWLHHPWSLKDTYFYCFKEETMPNFASQAWRTFPGSLSSVVEWLFESHIYFTVMDFDFKSVGTQGKWNGMSLSPDDGHVRVLFYSIRSISIKGDYCRCQPEKLDMLLMGRTKDNSLFIDTRSDKIILTPADWKTFSLVNSLEKLQLQVQPFSCCWFWLSFLVYTLENSLHFNFLCMCACCVCVCMCV